MRNALCHFETRVNEAVTALAGWRIFCENNSIVEKVLRFCLAFEVSPCSKVSTVRAACCSPIPKLPAGASASFGYVPPPVIPLEEVYRGLPEPDMIVQEGDGDVPKEGIPE